MGAFNSSPETEKKPTILVVVALYEEVEGICQELRKELKLIYENTDIGQKVWTVERDNCTLCIALCGVLEHNCVSLSSHLIVSLKNISLLVNFGCVGATCGMGLKIGEWGYAKEARHYDIGANVRPQFRPNFSLYVPKVSSAKQLVCTTGWRFTKGQPGCDCEDMELYGLASLCEAHKIPIVGIKYAANYCNDNALEDFKKNVVASRQSAQNALMAFLSEYAAKGPSYIHRAQSHEVTGEGEQPVPN